MITALFIYDSKGDVLISKICKDGVKRNICDVFRIQVIANNARYTGDSSGGKDVRSPVLTFGSTSFIHIRSGFVWVCAVTRSNQDCTAVLEFLYNLEALLKACIEPDPNIDVLSDTAIINHFYLIYEVLDEILEFGFPTKMDPNCLKGVQLSPAPEKMFRLPLKRLTSALNKLSNGSKETNGDQKNVAQTRKDSVTKYRRNEAFIKVEEKMHVLMNANSEILKAQVNGAIHMKSHLSGNPICKIGLNDKSFILNRHGESPASQNGNVALDDFTLHQCVERNKVEQDGIIMFTPPDGEFQLMTYTCLQNIAIPFKVHSQIDEINKQKLMYKVIIDTLYPQKMQSNNVKLKLPTPVGVIKSDLSTSLGKAKFNAEENCIIWRFNKLFGGQQHVMTGEIMLADSYTESNTASLMKWSRPPIRIDFTLDMFSCSGLAVKYLKVNELSGYKTIKWVEYVTHSSAYEIRC